MSWWDFGLTCGLALQALLLWRLVRVLRQIWQEKDEANRHLVSRIYSDIREIERKCDGANRQSAKACEGVRMLGAVDIGVLHDSGWLILCARIDGRDWVKIQELKRGMTLEQYKELVRNLEHLGAEFRYVDGPAGSFVKEYISRR